MPPKRARSVGPGELSRKRRGISPSPSPDPEISPIVLTATDLRTRSDSTEELSQTRQRTSPSPSPDHDISPSLPLTATNLRDWELLQESTMAPASTDDENRKPLDNEIKLNGHGIFVNRRRRRPAQLEAHVQSVVFRPREETTPSAKRIAETSPWALALGEQSAIDLLGPSVLCRGQSDGGAKYVASLSQLHLNTAHFPSADAYTKKEIGTLSQAQPDTIIGYALASQACVGPIQAPFTVQQELSFIRDAVTSSLHFPFLTCQWKSYRGTGGQYHASLQGARDGVCIINHLYKVYTEAGIEPTVVDTCHFSVTSDMDTVRLWVHWREEAEDGSTEYYMEPVKFAPTNPIEGDADAMSLLVGYRKMIRNILEYATGQRLDNLKGVITQLRTRKIARHASSRPSSKLGSSTTSASTLSNLGNSLNNAPQPTPLTPSSPSSRPSPLKRARPEQTPP